MEWKLLEEKKFAWLIFDHEMQNIKIINKRRKKTEKNSKIKTSTNNFMAEDNAEKAK